jgi:hypothetical protein
MYRAFDSVWNAPGCQAAGEQRPTSPIGTNFSLQKRVAGPAFLSFGPSAMVERGRAIVNVGLSS